MTKAQYIEAIVDLFNKHAKGKLNDAQKKHITHEDDKATPIRILFKIFK